MNFYLEVAISSCIFVGGTFIFVGSLGLVKLPNLMSRLHAPSKATTVGVGGCLVASMLKFTAVNGAVSIQELLITFFLVLTAPVTAHFIAKAYLHTEQGERGELPATSSKYDWSTFSVVPQESGKIPEKR